MRVLLDHCMPRGFRRYLSTHHVKTAREMGWEGLDNGALLAAAATEFDVFLSVDKKIQYEHDLNRLPIPTILLDAFSNALPGLAGFAPQLQSLLQSKLDPALYIIKRDGGVSRLGNSINPRNA